MIIVQIYYISHKYGISVYKFYIFLLLYINNYSICFYSLINQLQTGSCMKKYFITVLSFCALLIYTARVYANAGALILREEKEYSVWTNAEIFEDKKGSISDNDILKPSFQSKFSPWTFSVPNFGYTNSV